MFLTITLQCKKNIHCRDMHPCTFSLVICSLLIESLQGFKRKTINVTEESAKSATPICPEENKIFMWLPFVTSFYRRYYYRSKG